MIKQLRKLIAKRPHILVVDDEYQIASMLREYLEDEGYDVEVAWDGRSGRQCAFQKKPDLILTDIYMPGMDGLAMMQSIYDQLKIQDIPVIFMSGRAETDMIPPGSRYALLQKPFSLPLLNQIVHKFLL